MAYSVELRPFETHDASLIIVAPCLHTDQLKELSDFVSVQLHNSELEEENQRPKTVVMFSNQFGTNNFAHSIVTLANADNKTTLGFMHDELYARPRYHSRHTLLEKPETVEQKIERIGIHIVRYLAVTDEAHIL